MGFREIDPLLNIHQIMRLTGSVTHTVSLEEPNAATKTSHPRNRCTLLGRADRRLA